ncbi:hypothetical protein [Rhizobium sp. X9]|uniref:hypothetical protein n=1 Tax=Rhizobium sp. X9 TaxID=2815360 RepID=UPI001C0DE04F|nr:hypothetical protein [Rhizobium sp. X9]
MQKKTTLSDLKQSLSGVMISMAKSSNDVDHGEAIKELKVKEKAAIKVLNERLVDFALMRLATEVGRKKTKGMKSQGGIDLFGIYTGVPDMMSTGKRKSKSFWKASLKEGKEWLKLHSGEPVIDPDRNKGVAFLIADLSPYSVTGDESFEELAILKAKALGQIEKAD